jgi:hypothetical protein
MPANARSMAGVDGTGAVPALVRIETFTETDIAARTTGQIRDSNRLD